MKEFYNKTVLRIDNLRKSGFFYVVISDCSAKIITFVAGMIIVRILTKQDYGLYSYVNNALSILLLFGDAGAAYAYFQYGQENINNLSKVKGFCSYGLRISFAASIISSVVLFLSPLFYPYVLQGAGSIVMLVCLIPIVKNAKLFLQTNLRVYMLYKRFAFQNFVDFVITYVFVVVFAYFFGAKGAVLSQYVYGILALFMLLVLNRKLVVISPEYKGALNEKEKKAFNKFALSMKANDIISSVMTLIDVFMVGLLFKSEDIIAGYRVATIIPTALVFIPSSIMIYISPMFVQNNKNYSWVLKRTKYLMILTTLLCAFISGIGILTSRWMIPLIFGNQYSDARICYIILLVNFIIIGGIQMPIANVMTSQKIVRFKMIVLSVCGIGNVLLDLLLIHLMGSVGAALATTIISVALSTAYCVFFFRRMKTQLSVKVTG